jgi:hypothetical protein
MATELTPEEIQEILNEYNDALAKNIPISKELAEAMKDADTGIKNYTANLKNSINQLGTSMKSLGSGMVSGASGASVFNNSINATADVIDSFASKFGILGKIIGGVVTAGAKYVAAVNQQADALYKNYQDLSRSGLATGMQDTFKNLQSMGYTMSEIGNMAGLMKENSEVLAQFGGTAANGAKQFAIMAKDIQYSDLGTQFKLMGMSVDNINSGIAGYMKIQQASGTLQKQTSDQMAASAAAYIEEQDKLTKLTGMSADQQNQIILQAQSDQRYAATQHELRARGDAESLAKAKRNDELLLELTAQFGPKTARAFQDYASGMMNSEDAQKFRRTFGGAANMIDKGVTNTSQIIDQARKDADTAQNSWATQAKAGNANKYMTDYAETVKGAGQIHGATAEQQEQDALDQQKAQKDGTDKQTKNMVNLTTSQRNTTQSFDLLINKGINPTTSAMKGLAGVINDVVDIAGGAAGKEESVGGETTSLWGKIKSAFGGTPSTPAAAGGAVGAYGAKGGSVGSSGSVGGSQAQLQIKNAQGQLLETRKGGNINWRNNNPGNIRYGDFAIQMGAVGQNGGFAVFPTMEMGEKAQDVLLKGKNYANLSARQAIARWAPSSENNPDAYAKSVASQTGLDLNKRYVDMTPDEQKKFRMAMMKVEGGKAGEVIPATQTASNEEKKPSASKGGILSGSEQGYNATLHGTEAVVPLPDGKTIPVQMKGTLTGVTGDEIVNSPAYKQAYDKYMKDFGTTFGAKINAERVATAAAKAQMISTPRTNTEKTEPVKPKVKTSSIIVEEFNKLKSLFGTIKTEPVKTEPVKTEPVKTEPVKTEPVKIEPVKTEPVKIEPVKTEPVKTEPVKTEPVKIAQTSGVLSGITGDQIVNSPAYKQAYDKYMKDFGTTFGAKINAERVASAVAKAEIARTDKSKETTTSTYTVNGKPVEKATYDKFMSDNPQLGQMLDKTKNMGSNGLSTDLSLGFNKSSETLGVDTDLKSLSGPTSIFQSLLDGIQSKISPAEGKTTTIQAPEQPANTELKEQTHLLAQQLVKLDNLVNLMTKSNNINSKILQRQS